MNYSKIKVKQLFDLRNIVDGSEDRLTKDIKILSYLTKKPESYFESIDFKHLEYHRNTIAFLYDTQPQFRIHKYIFVNGRIYKLLTDVRKFSANRFLGIKAHVKGGIEANFNKLVALSYKPLFGAEKLDKEGNYIDLDPNEIERLEKAFNNVKLSKVAGGVFFYLNVSKALNGSMQIYLSSLITETD